MRQKLKSIHAPWRRFLITLVIDSLVLFSRFHSPRARVHWVGVHRRRRRLERPLILLLFLAAMLILRAREYAWWSTLIGGATSIYLTLYSVAMILPRKEYHWV